MTEQAWRWAWDPDYEHVAKGLPPFVIAESERLAGQLVDLAEMGIDITDTGEGPRAGRGPRAVPP